MAKKIVYIGAAIGAALATAGIIFAKKIKK